MKYSMKHTHTQINSILSRIASRTCKYITLGDCILPAYPAFEDELMQLPHCACCHLSVILKEPAAGTSTSVGMMGCSCCDTKTVSLCAHLQMCEYYWICISSFTLPLASSIVPSNIQVNHFQFQICMKSKRIAVTHIPHIQYYAHTFIQILKEEIRREIA